MRPQFAARAARILRRNHSASAKQLADEPVSHLWRAESYKSRVEELHRYTSTGSDVHSDSEPKWPRMPLAPEQYDTIRTARKLWEQTEQDNAWDVTNREMRVNGRVTSIRRHGKKLVFVNVSQGWTKDDNLQIMCSLEAMQSRPKLAEDFAMFADLIKPGDTYSFAGCLTKPSSSQHSLKATSLPTLLAPSLHERPRKLLDPEVLARFPQLELEQAEKKQRLHARSEMEFAMHSFFRERRFVHVHTPMLAADTGGAVAKSFETRAGAFSDRPLHLRIAPELELKKLVAAGIDRVYEIGQCFRNEGLDATHNPEFTTCEFYQAYGTLEDLIKTTEDLLRAITAQIAPERASMFARPFQRISFLSCVEEEIRKRGITDFSFASPLTQEACEMLLPLFSDLSLPQPTTGRASHILDSLASHLLEPLCVEPTFITDFPAIMSPLAKSYTDPTTGYELAARAELFIGGTEYVNMYEEENSPFAQARKFLAQKLESTESTTQRIAEEFNSATSTVDQLAHAEILGRLSPAQRYYIRVLEMGLPPTAGWGCGIERLVMLLTDAKRIGEVMPFGGLRSVVAMGT